MAFDHTIESLFALWIFLNSNLATLQIATQVNCQGLRREGEESSGSCIIAAVSKGKSIISAMNDFGIAYSTLQNHCSGKLAKPLRKADYGGTNMQTKCLIRIGS